MLLNYHKTENKIQCHVPLFNTTEITCSYQYRTISTVRNPHKKLKLKKKFLITHANQNSPCTANLTHLLEQCHRKHTEKQQLQAA